MKKNSLKIIFILLLISLFFTTAVAFAQERPLETEYPTIYGIQPETTETSFSDYVKYVFNFIIFGSGAIALLALIIGGVQYLTSAGNPSKMAAARQQISSTLLGISILFASYLLLALVNPELTVLSFKEIPEIPQAQVPATPIYSVPTADLLGRIKELSETIKQIPEEIEKTAKEIQLLTNNCACANTSSICACSGWTCQPSADKCYAGKGLYPCPEKEKIKMLQKKIIDWEDVLSYYKNRVLAEKNDLIIDIEKFLDEDIKWYEEKILEEDTALSQLPDEEGKKQKQKLIDYLKEQKSWKEEEKGYKTDLITKLEELANSIEKTKNPAKNISQLPDYCLAGIKTKCTPVCSGSCHNSREGCIADRCQGGNPCPTDEIQNQINELSPLPGKIINVCNEIIAVVNGIKEERIRQINL